jgi:1-acyl-sn-glycerol-3-phosphate acyltransferase
VDEAGPEALAELGRRLGSAGTDWSYYPPDPLARRIHSALADPVLQHEPLVTGSGHLEAVADAPLVIFANHLSYSDANVIEVLLQRSGAGDVSDRLTVIAGPKVYSNIRRRFSSLCFGTIKVPQSTARASEDAVMHPRDVARAAQRAIRASHDRLRLGEALLVFPEGSRSRSGEMQPFLPGVARYLDFPGTWILPIALTGTEKLFPLGEDALHPVRITLRIGRAVPAALLRSRANNHRRLMIDALGAAIAALLPPQYRGVYGEDSAEAARARRLLDSLSG